MPFVLKLMSNTITNLEKLQLSIDGEGSLWEYNAFQIENYLQLKLFANKWRQKLGELITQRTIC